MDLEKKLN